MGIHPWNRLLHTVYAPGMLMCTPSSRHIRSSRVLVANASTAHIETALGRQNSHPPWSPDRQSSLPMSNCHFALSSVVARELCILPLLIHPAQTPGLAQPLSSTPAQPGKT